MSEKVERALSGAPANLRGPDQVRLDPACQRPVFAQLRTRDDWERAKLQLVLDKLAEGTKKSYGVGWRWWALFCRARGASPLREVGPNNRREEEDLQMEFVIHAAVNGHKKVGTIRQYLSAVRSQHLALGYPDPTAGAGRLWMAIDGLTRRHGAPKRKKPVTPAMLRWVKGSLQPWKSHDDAAVYCAVLMAFFFLLRASEYVVNDQSEFPPGRGLRGSDLRPRCKGEPVDTFALADEVAIRIRGSKTDQYNRGEWRNHFRVAGEESEEKLCVLQALTWYERWARDRCRGLQAEDPFFRA